MMEWVWLLRRYSRASGTRVDDLCARLFAAGMSLGRDPASGFLVDEVDARGRSIGAGRRLWPQTEYRSEEHTSELQSLMRISYAVFCLKNKKNKHKKIINTIS